MSRQVTMPRLSQDMETGQIVEWLKVEGDDVLEGEPLLVVETDKANVEVEAPASGVLRRIVAGVGEDAVVGSVLAIIAGADEVISDASASPASPVSASLEPAATSSVAPAAAPLPSPGKGPVRAGRQPSSPAARRVAAELGVDLAMVHGSGDGGLVTEADVRALAQAGSGSRTDVSDTEIPLIGRRRRMADRLSLSRRTAADVTTVIDVDMSAVAAHRTESRRSYTAYVAWATARALKAYPTLNASFAEDRILVHPDIHLGVAAAADEGLVVPVIRNADKLGLTEVAEAIDELSAAARQGTTSPEDLSGSTFTITNSGTFGSLFFTPIINLPEVAILGMGRVADAPVVRDGAVAVGKGMYLSLSYDHRAVEGAAAVSFVAEVKRLLETAWADDA